MREVWREVRDACGGVLSAVAGELIFNFLLTINI